MDWNWYLFCFEGRINRAKWWLSLPIVFGWLIFLLLMSILVARIVFKGPAVDIDIGIDEMFTLIRRATDHSLSRNDIVSLVTNFLGMPIVIWIILATSIKRLHDRDRSGWWIVPFFALPSFSKDFASWLPDSLLTLLLGIALLILWIWGFFELGFLRGSPRTNLYGPSPLPKVQSRPRSTRTRLRATSGWDQESEIEMLPHIGSPPTGMRVNRGHD